MQSVTLENLDVTGSVAFAGILDALHHHHSFLVSFNCHQIAQNSFRLFFPTLGNVSCTENFTKQYRADHPDFFDDFLTVHLSKYTVKMEQWEGVQERIGMLKDDIRISALTYHPDHGSEFIHWTIEP